MKSVKKSSYLILFSIISFIFLMNMALSQETAGQLYEKALYLEEGKGELPPAIKLYQQILDQYPDDREVRAKAQLHIGICNEKLGLKEAIDAYQKVIVNYPEFTNEVSVAKQNLKRLSNVFDETLKKSNFRKIRIPTKITWNARLSPDGQKLTLASDGKLWFIPLSGKLGAEFSGVPVELNTGDLEIENSGLAWSGDGKWIVFNEVVRKEEQEGNQCIYMVSSEGGKPKKVVENWRDVRIINYRISLSPQGKTLAFSSIKGNKQHIYTISTDGGVPKLLVDSLAREPVFSPDGKLIAYVEDKNLGRAGGGLWVVPADGGTAKLVANAGMASSPIWSPESDMIAFVDCADEDHIYIIPITEDGEAAGDMITIDAPEGTGEIRLLAGWTPDDKIGVIFRGLTEFGLYTLPAKGGKAALVVHGGYPTQPRWSPDGKRIFHTNNKDGGSGDWEKYAIASIPAEGGEVTTVPIQSDEKIIKPGYGGGNNVSPDGKMIVFSAQTEKDTSWHWQIWTLPVNGGKPKQLTETPDWVINGFPCWSPDGEAIAFVRTKEDENYTKGNSETNIHIIPVDGGDPKPLTLESDSVAFRSTAWSPDGKLIAFFSEDEEDQDNLRLKIISVNDGDSRMVAKVQGVGIHSELAWSPDSKRIAFNGSEDMIIKVISIEDGNIEDIKTELVDLTEIYHFDWSPDGTKFVFGGWQGGNAELWIMEDFLPLVKQTK